MFVDTEFVLCLDADDEIPPNTIERYNYIWANLSLQDQKKYIGICSLKVEGRMRSIYYIATVINTYRRAIDDYYNGMLDDKKIKKYLKVLNRVANRDNAVQFFDKFPTEEEQYFGERE